MEQNDFTQGNDSIRLVATDLDGTLLDNPKIVPREFIDWVLRHPEICVVIASGRQYFNLQRKSVV